MSILRVFGIFAIVCCAASFGVSGAQAQGDVAMPEWMHVGSVTAGWTAIYFFDAIHGIIASGGTLSYLEPTGMTAGHWYNANMPSGITFIRQIRFIRGKLYAASQGTDALVSLDSGRSWQFSGLGLVNANDVYADGTGTIRMLQDPMKVFARLDTMHCIAQGTANIFVSSDGGLNWVSSGVPMNDSNSTGAFADRCYDVYVCPNSWGTAFRSNDLGKTWQSVNTGSGVGSEWLYGASTVPYITNSYGMFRSTDDGLTWISVITVTGGPHIMYVWGPMGEHAAIGWLGNAAAQSIGVWMTTTGGLDDLHSGINMTDSNGAPLMQQDTFNVPWELTSTCKPYLIPIAFWADVDGLTEKVTISDSLGDFALLGRDSLSLPMHREDTIWMQYDPHHPVDNVLLTFENHWHCSDWTETRTVHVDAIPKALITSPLLFFAGCLPDTEAALIHLDSCQTLCIDSVAIPSSMASGLKLLTSLPDTANIGARDSLLFRLTSSDSSNSLSDSITVYAHYLGLDSILDDYFYFPHAWGDDTNFSLFSARIPIGFEYPVAWELALSPPDSAEAGGTVTYQIIQHGTLPADDTSVDFVLAFYDDLLGMDAVDQVDEPWTKILGYHRSADGLAHYRFHVSPLPTDSVVATIHLTAYQARMLSTQLSLESIQFSSNPSRPSDCIASASLGNSEFTIRTSCGGPLLFEALNGLLTIDGISPNPTTGSVSLRYTLGGPSMEATIELEDALGRTVLEQTAPLRSGPNQSIALDLSKLPAGMYLARLAMPGTTQFGAVRSARIIKE